MTRDKEQFNKLDAKDGGHVTFGDNTKGKIIGIGEIGNPLSLSIHHVLFVDGLKHNLLSISQLCEMENKVTFYPKNYFVSSLDEDKVIFNGERVDNVYVIDLNKIDNKYIKCLMSIFHDTWTLYRRLGHANFELSNDLYKHELMIGLPKLEFTKDKPCDACQKGKQSKSSFKLKNIVYTSRPLKLIHMDLFGPTRVVSLGGKYYTYVLVDDYSRFTWMCFSAHKNDAFKAFEIFLKRVQKEKGFCISSIRGDHGMNLKINSSKPFVMKMIFYIRFLLIELLNKMG